MTPRIIGVDGGGTKTLAWLALLDGAPMRSVMRRGTAGPGNPRAAGFEVAQQNIAAAIRAAFEAAGREHTSVAAAWLGLAGAGREGEQSRIEAWAYEQRIATAIRVSGDVEIVLGGFA